MVNTLHGFLILKRKNLRNGVFRRFGPEVERNFCLSAEDKETVEVWPRLKPAALALILGQELLSLKCRHAAHACAGDGLAVNVVGQIACRKNPRD